MSRTLGFKGHCSRLLATYELPGYQSNSALVAVLFFCKDFGRYSMDNSIFN